MEIERSNHDGERLFLGGASHGRVQRCSGVPEYIVVHQRPTGRCLDEVYRPETLVTTFQLFGQRFLWSVPVMISPQPYQPSKVEIPLELIECQVLSATETRAFVEETATDLEWGRVLCPGAGWVVAFELAMEALHAAVAPHFRADIDRQREQQRLDEVLQRWRRDNQPTLPALTMPIRL